MNTWQNNAPKFYLVSIIVQVLLSLVALAALPAGSDAYVYLSYTLPQVANIGVIACGLKLVGERPSAALPLKKPDPVLLLLCLPLAAALYAQNLIFAQLFGWLLSAVGVEAGVAIPAGRAWWNVLLDLILLCALPALGEELMFRGVLPKTFERRGILSTLLLSALAFALAHGNPAQLVHQFLLAAALVYLTRKTSSLSYAVLIHFLNNVLAVVLSLTLPAGTLAAPTPANLGILFALFAGGVVLLYPTLFLFCMRAASATRADLPGRAKQIFWFDAPERAGERLTAWEVAMWIFLVVLLVTNVLAATLGG